jgi:hypothetical protein
MSDEDKMFSRTVVQTPLKRYPCKFYQTMKVLAICIFFSACAWGVNAQNIRNDKLVWKVTSSVNLKNGDEFSYQCEIKTNATNTVTWIQKQGQKTTEFIVRAIEGEWTDISNNGSVVYKITQDGKGGTLNFARSGGGSATITIDFSESSENGARQKLLVEQVQREN